MKIIINEWQFLISKGLITEDKYQDAIKKLNTGDNLEYTDDKGDKLTFRVIFNDSGQVYLKNLDSGVYKNNYFFITVSDLSKNNLTFKTINVPKNLPDNLKNEKKDSIKLAEILKKFPVSTWKKSTFKNISKLNIDGENIDIEKPDAEDEKFKNYIKVSDINPFLDELKGMKSGNVYRLTLSNGGIIDLNLIDNKNDSLFFEYSDAKGPAKVYNELINAELMLDINSSSVQQMVSSLTNEENVESVYNITFKKLISGNGDDNNRSYKKILIKNIIGIDLVSSPNKKENKKGEPVEEKHIEDISDEEIDDMTSEDITDLVLNNPTFKAAFLSKPGFWRKLVGGKPKGILAAKSILKKFNFHDNTRGDKKEKDLVIDFFKNNEEYFVQLLDKSFNRGDITLDITKKYKVKAKKRTNIKGGITVFLYGNGFMFKINTIYGDTRDEFRATLIIDYNTEDEYRENRTIKVTDAY
jgi:hypothetical protein